MEVLKKFRYSKSINSCFKTVKEFTGAGIGEQVTLLKNIAEQMITGYRSEVFLSGKYEGYKTGSCHGLTPDQGGFY